MPEPRVLKTEARPDCEVLVDGTWCPGELRAWFPSEDGTWRANRSGSEGPAGRYVDTVPADRVRQVPLRLADEQ